MVLLRARLRIKTPQHAAQNQAVHDLRSPRTGDFAVEHKAGAEPAPRPEMEMLSI